MYTLETSILPPFSAKQFIKLTLFKWKYIWPIKFSKYKTPPKFEEYIFVKLHLLIFMFIKSVSYKFRKIEPPKVLINNILLSGFWVIA